MSWVQKNREIGCICCDYDLEFLMWKIPNVSSIPHEADYFVRSPTFSYADALWTLKIYPYGQTKYETTGYMDVVIERLHSLVKAHGFKCRWLYGEKPFNSLFDIPCRQYFIEPKWTEAKRCRFIKNLKECPEKRQLAPNDIFTLVCALEKLENKPGVQIEPNKTDVGKSYAASGKNGSEVGELIKEDLIFKSFGWKVICSETFQFPEDYQVQSPPITLAGGLWILKMYPYLWMKQSRRPKCDVLLERLQSEIPEHRVMFKIGVGSDRLVYTGSYTFNSHSTKGNVIAFDVDEEYKSDFKCVYFSIEVCMKKNVETQSNPAKILKSCSNSSKETFGENPKSSVTTSKDLPKGSTAEKPESSASASKGSTTISGSSPILKNYKKFYLQKEDSDVIIRVEGKEFPAHKLILKAQSPVLAAALRLDMKEKRTGVIDVEDCEASVFSDFLYFLYCGEVKRLSKENVFSLFTVAEKYDVSNLKTICMEFIKKNLSVDTFFDAYSLGHLYSEAELILLSTDFFAKNYQEIIDTVKWQSFIIDNPTLGNELMIKALSD